MNRSTKFEKTDVMEILISIIHYPIGVVWTQGILMLHSHARRGMSWCRDIARVSIRVKAKIIRAALIDTNVHFYYFANINRL